ncbi:MAG: TatD family hydrolase [Deltaproteobacteria bacterium]|nr:TatD family hydrolase [Deltaproteobacteria bacterium]
MLIDTHAHLDMEEFERDREAVLLRALQSGVGHIITIGIDLPSSRKAIEIADKHDHIHATVGYHPHHADEVNTSALRELGDLAQSPKVVAWGEIGLDFFRLHSSPQNQVKAFERQLDIAREVGLPVVIHVRDAHKELIEILKGRGSLSGGVIHCFSGDYETAGVFMDMGFSISIPGTVTYKKAAYVREVAAKIPLGRLMVETDAPFLAPVPFRGKRNEPAFVKFTASEIARLRGIDFEALAEATTKNAQTLFKLTDIL